MGIARKQFLRITVDIDLCCNYSTMEEVVKVSLEKKRAMLYNG